MNKDYANFKTNIKLLRLSRDESVNHLSSCTGIGTRRYYKLEEGKIPTASELIALAKHFNVNATDLAEKVVSFVTVFK